MLKLTVILVVAIVGMILRGEGKAALVLTVGGVLFAIVLVGTATMLAFPKLTLDLAQPAPLRADCPDWLTKSRTGEPQHVQLRHGDERKLNLFADDHAADFDSRGRLSHLQLIDMRQDRADGIKAIDELTAFFKLKARLRNTELDRPESVDFRSDGWRVHVEMLNLIATTDPSRQPLVGYRLTLDR